MSTSFRSRNLASSANISCYAHGSLIVPNIPPPRRKATTSLLAKPINHLQSRQESTLRRQRKAWNIPPLPIVGGPPAVPTGGSGRSHKPRSQPTTVGDTIVYNPPSSAPNVYHTPSIFLPREDPRRRLMERSRLMSSATLPARPGESSTQPASSSHPARPTTGLPPRLNPHLPAPGPKRYHLEPAQIEEMRALRAEDEYTWTRAKLAAKFDCSIFFVQQVCQASGARRQMLDERLNTIKTRIWGKKRRTARVDRVRRRELWGRDE